MLRLGVTLLLCFIISPAVAAPFDTTVSSSGWLIDGRGQVVDSPIEVPHPDKVPELPNLTQTETNFEQYYKVNFEGYRRDEDRLPIVPEYTAHYSTRVPHSYDKEQYIEVWKAGEKVGKIDSLTEDYAISFFSVSNWATAIPVAKWRARKVPQEGAAFLYVEDVGSNAGDMYKAKKWAELWNTKIFFGTIDGGIPVDWVQ